MLLQENIKHEEKLPYWSIVLLNVLIFGYSLYQQSRAAHPITASKNILLLEESEMPSLNTEYKVLFYAIVWECVNLNARDISVEKYAQ